MNGPSYRSGIYSINEAMEEMASTLEMKQWEKCKSIDDQQRSNEYVSS